MTMNPDESIDSDWTERELLVLRSADLDAPPRGADDRTLVALGLAAAGGAGAGVGTVTVMKAAGQAPLWLKWAGLALLGGGVVGAVLLAKHRTISHVPTAPPIATATHAPVVAPAPAPPPPPAVDVSALPLLVDSAPVKSSDASKDTAKNSLSDEIRLIDDARTRLRAGDPSGSLQVLDRYDQLVKKGGSMQAEATVVRIEALQANGAGERARALGDRFLAKNPSSPYADYVRHLLAHGD